MGKVFAYARVSTPRQGEKGVSLHEQKSAIVRYAEQHGHTIVRWFEERETAAKTGRAEFTKMLQLLRLKLASGVIIHKIDRSARNLEDWADLGKLVDAGADIHFAIENLDLKTVAGRLSADIQAVVAAHYSRNLREEAKKGFYGRLKQGFYPLRAPIGYLDQGTAKPKLPDPERASLVQKVFELYSTGTISLPNLVTEAYRLGLRNRNGGRVSMNGVATMLRNPFYVGFMKIHRTHETFRGTHEPLISTKTFETVQFVLDGKRVDRRENHVFLFSRLVRCARCGYSLIAELQKGHAYYRCHNRPFKNPKVCPPTSIREEQLDSVVVEALMQVDLTEEEYRAGREFIQTHREGIEQNRRERERALNLRHEQLRNRLSTLADVLLDGSIDHSLYEEKHKALLKEQTILRAQMRELEAGNDPMLKELETTVELAKSPSLLYKMASLQRRRELLKILLSNLAVSSKNVEITLSLPFRLIKDREKNTECRANRGTCRTWEKIFTKLQSYLLKLPDRAA